MRINRKQIMETFIRITQHISDKEYQERVWIAGEGPECQAFDDAVCNFFDIGDPIIEEYKDFGITENQYMLLKKFRDQFRVFADENDFPEVFIDSPEWAQIMALAKDVVKAFNDPKNGQNTA
jgi:hypothetical protein